RTSADICRHTFRHRRGTGVVDVALARRLGPGTLDAEDFRRRAVIERQHIVGLGFLEPGVDQRLELLGVFVSQVDRLRAVLIDVVKFPFILVEIALAGERSVYCRCFPTFLPDAAGAEHGVVLALLLRLAVGRERVLHRHTRQWYLFHPAESFGRFDADAVEDRRHDVHSVVILVAYLAPGLDTLRP